MDPETLVTFLFRAPPEARTVELLGSWDNFAHPYRMHPDRRRGHGAWSGCFKFLDIIFDGDDSTFHKPRTGGLKQGGTYWYYYRLDDDIEAYDDSRETTTACPLLPGQSMNVIDVPIEVAEPLARSRSASVDALDTTLPTTHTLEPQDKFAALAPPPPSKVHARCVSEIALAARKDDAAEASNDWSEVARPRERNPHFSSDPPFARETSLWYHANTRVADDGSSIYTRQSWTSTACSSVRSFILDAYEVEPSPFADEEDAAYFPSVDAPPMPSRAPPAVPASVSDASEPQPCEEGDVVEEQDSTPSPPPPSRPPPAIPVEAQEPIDLDPHAELAADTPPPPLTSFRPDLRLDLHRLNAPNPFYQTTLTTSPTKSPTDNIRSTELEYLRRQSSDQSQADEDDDDILSPTFSAATVSSRGGLNTPFRVSIGQLCHASGFVSEDDASMEKVTERLRSLGHEGEYVLTTTNSAPTAFPSPIAEVDEATFAPFSTFSNLADGSSKSPFLLDRRTSPPPSLANAMFTEFGHLGPSIA